jgi:hypothetical protein
MSMKTTVKLSLVLAVIVAAVIFVVLRQSPSTSEPGGFKAPPAKAGQIADSKPANPPSWTSPNLTPGTNTDLSAVPETVRLILDRKADRTARWLAVRGLTFPLTMDEKDAIYGFLQTRHAEDGEQLGQVLKNELLDALCAQMPLPVDLADLLARMYRDREQNEVIRDYALQHLFTYYEKVENGVSAEAATTIRAQVQEVFWEALSEVQTSIAGTALLGLSRLAETHRDLNTDRVAAAASQLATDVGAGELTRISAVQVCGRLKVLEVLPALKEVAETASSIPLRVSAIGVLGFIGGGPELDLLERILSDVNGRLKPAATLASKRIKHRLAEKLPTEAQTL